jgi:RNA polymerase sigma-70 factor (ECF subfamily)
LGLVQWSTEDEMAQRLDEQAQVSDEALLDQFRRGDRAAFEGLARRYERLLLGLASGLLDGRDDMARDAIQETWLRVIRFAAGFDGRSSFKTWLYRIAINQCRTVKSKRRGEPVMAAVLESAGVSGGNCGW